MVRLGGEDVESGPGELAGTKRLGEGVLVDERAARRVDEPRAVTHPGDGVAVDQAVRLVGQRRMERDHVGHAEELVDGLRLLDAEIPKALGPDERVVRGHRHAEPERTTRNLLADPTETDDTQCLPGHLHPAPARTLPAAVLERRVRLRDVPREGEDQPDRLLGGGDDRRLGSIRDDDAAPRRRVDVDVVDAHTGPADHLESLRPIDDVLGQACGGPDHDAVVAVDDLGERRVRVDVDLEATPEELDAGLGDRLADEDAHRAHSALRPRQRFRMPRARRAPRSRARRPRRRPGALPRSRSAHRRSAPRSRARCGRSGTVARRDLRGPPRS